TADCNPNRRFWATKKLGGSRTGSPLFCRVLDGQRLQVDRLLFEDPGRLLALLLVVVKPGPGGDELADDHVLFQASQAVDLARDRGLGEDPRRLLEGCR